MDKRCFSLLLNFKMTTESHLYQIFQRHIESVMETGENLLSDIEEASQILASSLVDGGKILTCGNGTSSAISQILCNNLATKFERERPSLPAFQLGTNLTSLTATATEKSYSDIFSREVKSLGENNDVLVVYSSSGNPPNLIQAIQAAHERNLRVITLTGRDGGNVAALMDTHDKELRVPSNSRSRIHELHLLITFCLCDLIDQQLFGPLEP